MPPGNGLAETSGRTAQELLEEFEQTGNQAPFEEIVRRYGGMVYSVCYQVTRNAHDAEDAAQATFLTLAVQHKSSRSVKYVGPWLQHVAYRTSLDLRRSHKRRVAREERHGAMELQSGRLEPIDPPVDGDEVRTILREELNKLPAKYRLPLILHYFGGLTPGEISKELGCRPKTLGVRLFRGRKMLAQNLAERGVMMSAGFLAVALIDAIQHTVAQGFIANTSHAAAHMAAGQYLPAACVSGNVLGLTRIAGRAVVLSKLKITFAIVMMCATAMSGAAEMVRRYSPTNWQLQLDVPRLLNQGIRALLNGLRRPLSGFAEAPPIDTSNVPSMPVVAVNDARFVHSGNYWLPADLGNPNVIPMPSLPGSASGRRTTPTLSAQSASASTRGGASGSGSIALAGARLYDDIASTAIRLTNDGTSLVEASAPNHLDDLRLRGGHGDGVGSMPDAAFASNLAAVFGPQPFAHDAAQWYAPRPSTSIGPQPFGSSDLSYAMGPQPPRGTHSGGTNGGGNPLPTPHDGGTDSGNGSGGNSSGGGPHSDVLATASVTVAPGTHTYGFDPAAHVDPTEALVHVNDVQVTMFNVASAGGHAQIQQLSVGSSRVPSLPAVEGQNMISVWAFDTTATTSGGVDLVVHYDDLVPQLQATNTSYLRLWAYDDGQWLRLADSSLMTDMGTNLIWGHADELQFFAVSSPSGVPEPTGATILLLCAGLIGISRRRRGSAHRRA